MKYYKIIMSNKDSINIDENDFKKLEGGMNSGSFVQLKKAVVNPSFIVAVVPITQKDALESEMSDRKIEGHIDDETRTFKITEDKRPVLTGLKNEM